MNAHYFLYDSSKRESGLIINQMTNSIYMAISEAKKGAGHGRRARSCFWGLMTEFVIGAAQTGTTSRNTDRHRSLSLSQTKSSHPKSLNRLVRWFVCVRLTDFWRLASWAVASHAVPNGYPIPDPNPKFFSIPDPYPICFQNHRVFRVSGIS